VLVETHSWKKYEHRVKITFNTIVSLAGLVAAQGQEWLRLCRQADETAKALGGRDLTLDYVTRWREPSRAGASVDQRDDSGARTIEFRGYAYTRTESPISGALVTAYDPKTPQIWRVPMRDAVKPLLVVRAPGAGYVVPVGFVPEIAPRLAAHGIATVEVKGRRTGVRANIFRATDVKFSAAPFEGRMRTQLDGAWSDQIVNIESGALFVPITQPLARLVAALFEPRAPDSLAAWGFFNACFEQKEQMEPYVAEQIAAQMLAADPALRAEFTAKLEADPYFAASPGDRLEFFLRRHASWDERYNLYPVMRVDIPL
jgi:hypothetical protein